MQIKLLAPSSSPPNLLRKAAAFLVTLALAAVALIFSAVALTLLLISIVIGGVYLGWKLRAMHKQMQAQGFAPPGSAMQDESLRGEGFTGEIIEGEVVRVSEPAISIETPTSQRRPH